MALLVLPGLTLTPLAAASAKQPLLVAAAHPLAAQAGMQVLRAGGGAVDAAIAVQAVLTLVEPQSSGIGGGAFMLHWRASDARLDAYDGRETAPAAAGPELFLRPDGRPMAFFDAVVGGRAVGAPGVLAMLELAHDAHGKLPWAVLFNAAIRLAENGFRVTPRLHRLLARDRFLKASPTAAGYFYDAGGRAWPVGHLLKNPALAKTLRAVAAKGAKALAQGAIAEAMVAAIRGHAENPGLLSLDDLAAYRPLRRAPVCIPYHGARVCGMPPPTSGGVTVAQILGQLRQTPIAAAAPGSLSAIHLISEAEKRAYADRDRYLADPDFVSVPVAALLDPAYLRRRGAGIDPARASGRALPGLPKKGAEWRDGRDLTQPATSHFAIADAGGNVVSMTASVENAFGARILVGGFLLNNQLTDFSFAPRQAGDGGGDKAIANAVAPGKRPRSSMSPTIVLDRDGGFRLAVGSPGGSRIIGYVARTLIAVLDWNMSLQEAMALPHHVNRNGPIDLEAETGIVRRADGLRAMGHEVAIRPLNSGLHGVEYVGGVWRGGADPRREGVLLKVD